MTQVIEFLSLMWEIWIVLSALASTQSWPLWTFGRVNQLMGVNTSPHPPKKRKLLPCGHFSDTQTLHFGI